MDRVDNATCTNGLENTVVLSFKIKVPTTLDFEEPINSEYKG